MQSAEPRVVAVYINIGAALHEAFAAHTGLYACTPGCACCTHCVLGYCVFVVSTTGSALYPYRIPARWETTESLTEARSFLFCLLQPRIFQKRSLGAEQETHNRRLSLWCGLDRSL